MTKAPAHFDRIIGIVGGAASGKNTVADIFSAHGYTHVSSSDLVREEIAKRGQQTSRQLQTATANELRVSQGIGYWVDLSVGRIDDQSKLAVISGLYSPGEGQHLIDTYHGILVGVVAGVGDDSATRYDRLQKRASGIRDTLTRSEFIAANQRENGGRLAHETNIAQLLSMASYIIYNTEGIEHLEQQTEEILEELRGVDK